MGWGLKSNLMYSGDINANIYEGIIVWIPWKILNPMNALKLIKPNFSKLYIEKSENRLNWIFCNN